VELGWRIPVFPLFERTASRKFSYLTKTVTRFTLDNFFSSCLNSLKLIEINSKLNEISNLENKELVVLPYYY